MNSSDPKTSLSTRQKLLKILQDTMALEKLSQTNYFMASRLAGDSKLKKMLMELIRENYRHEEIIAKLVHDLLREEGKKTVEKVRTRRIASIREEFA